MGGPSSNRIRVLIWEGDMRTQTHTEDKSCEEPEEEGHLQAKERDFRKANPADTFISEIRPLELWGNKFIISATQAIVVIIPALENDYT